MIRYHTTWGDLCQIVMCLFIFLASCRSPGSKPEDLSIYYLPISSIPVNGMVYSYRNVLDTTANGEVWQHILTSEGHLSSINYNSNQQVVQKQYEKWVDNGVLIDSLILFFPVDSITRQQIRVRILSPNKFPFDADSSKVWLTKFEWWQPGDSLHVVLERRRRYKGHTTWLSNGKSIPAIHFTAEDKFETEEVGWTSSEWTGEEIYAKGIGLVHYTRNISPQLKVEFELESRKPGLYIK